MYQRKRDWFLGQRELSHQVLQQMWNQEAKIRVRPARIRFICLAALVLFEHVCIQTGTWGEKNETDFAFLLSQSAFY